MRQRNRASTAANAAPLNGYTSTSYGGYGLTPPPAPNPNPNVKTHVGASRIFQYKLSRFNPIRNLTPDTLSQQLDQFEMGNLNYCARTWEAIAERDDTLKNVIGKRSAQVKRMDWQVLINSDIKKDNPLYSEALKHQETLKYFWSNARARNAIDQDEEGGVRLLIEQMLKAIAYQWAVHELVFEPSPKGLTCCFNYVPLWFFENMTGRMRYLESEGAFMGSDLIPNEWMITKGPGLMKACSVAYMYKNMSLRQWVTYIERYGSPAPIGKTSAAKNTAEWDNMVDAVEKINDGFAAVIGNEDEIDSINFSADGQAPFPPLVERMDRHMSAIWMGGDLSTMSKDSQAVGVNAQQDQGLNLGDDDARMIVETLKCKVEKFVLEYTFGEGTTALAGLDIISSRKQDVTSELEVDTFLLGAGGGLGMQSTYERYGRELPEADEEMLRQPTQQPNPNDPNNPIKSANIRGDLQRAALIRNAKKALIDAELVALTPVFDRLDGLVQIADSGDEDAFRVAGHKFLTDLPKMQREIARHPDAARALEGLITAGFLNGIGEAEVARN